MRVLLFLGLLAAAHAQTWRLVWEDNFDGSSINLTNWQHEVTSWGGGNSEFQTYTNHIENSYVSNGRLYIQPTTTVNSTNNLTSQPFGDEFLNTGTLDLVELYGVCTNPENDGCFRNSTPGAFNIPPVMSARLRSFERFSFKYGRVEIRAMMPTGDWLWPAIWLLPETWEYGDWPRSGEMDMVEIIGNEDLVEKGTGTAGGFQRMGCTMHWGPGKDANCYHLTHDEHENSTEPYGRNFHDYVMEWTVNGFKFSVDGVNVLTAPNPPIDQNPGWTGFWDFGAECRGSYEDPGWDTPMAPFDEDFHLIMNVAAGGTIGFIPDDDINRGGNASYVKPWSNDDDYNNAMEKFWTAKDGWEWTWTKEGDMNAMQVDYVRVYEEVIDD